MGVILKNGFFAICAAAVSVAACSGQGGGSGDGRPGEATAEVSAASGVRVYKFMSKRASNMTIRSDTTGTSGSFDFPATLVGVNGNVTVYYDDSLGPQGLSLAQQLLANSGPPYMNMEGYFGIAGQPVSVVIAPISGADDGEVAYHNGCDFTNGGVLYLDATFANTSVDPLNLEMGLYVAELSESFMGPQGKGWNCGGSNGEGLSRYLSEREALANTLDGYDTVPDWTAAGLPDWISQTEPTDGDFVSAGAAVAYIYWMLSRGYSIEQIVQTGASTLAQNYQTLTGSNTAYQDLKNAMAKAPAFTLNADDPFPVAGAPPLPEYVGCFTDTRTRDLSGPTTTSSGMTRELCTSWCSGQGYEYAGMQAGNQCFCGHSFGSHGTATNCNFACVGNTAEACGGWWANSVYATGYLGCFADTRNRDLTGVGPVSNNNMMPSACVTWCAELGYKYAGVQNGNSCSCGNSFGKYGGSSACSSACSGDTSQTCGGVWANAIYRTSAMGFLGCKADQSTRDLSGPTMTSSTETTDQCTTWCAGQGYEYAGLQAGNQCFCGHSYGRYGASKGNCTFRCTGNNGELCGGWWANSVYETNYLGCFTDTATRDLTGPGQTTSSNTPAACVAWCHGQGYPLAGVQDGNQCFCGNTAGQYGTSTACTSACTGDSSQTCGGIWANSIYFTYPPSASTIGD